MPRPNNGGLAARGPRLSPTSTLLAVSALVMAIGWATPAAAHTELEGSSPRDGARLASAPLRVVLRFTGPIAPEFARVQAAADGGPPEPLSVVVDGPEVTAGMPRDSAAAGEVTWSITYRVVSDDGHPITGEVRFTTAGPAPSTRAPSTSTTDGAGGASPTQSASPQVRPGAAEATSDDADDSVPRIAALIGLALLGCAAALAVLVRTRPRWLAGRRQGDLE